MVEPEKVIAGPISHIRLYGIDIRQTLSRIFIEEAFILCGHENHGSNGCLLQIIATQHSSIVGQNHMSGPQGNTFPSMVDLQPSAGALSSSVEKCCLNARDLIDGSSPFHLGSY